MKNYPVLIFTITLYFISFHAFSEETRYGIGAPFVSLFGISFPIDMGNLIIEPSFLIRDIDSESVGATSGSSNDLKNINIGMGLFRKKIVSNETYIYYGAKIGYTKFESTFSNTGSTFTSSNSSDEDGYFVAPTFGAVYLLGNDFSLGIDLEFSYSKIDGTDTTTTSISGATTFDTESTRYNSDAKIILRYMF